MAEGFARRYGSDVMQVKSAGLGPAPIIQPLTYKVMQEKNISLEGQHPKDVLSLSEQRFDLLINLSGYPVPQAIAKEIRDWKVPDPIGLPEEVYVSVREDIEMRVMMLILELRRSASNKGKWKPPRTLP